MIQNLLALSQVVAAAGGACRVDRYTLLAVCLPPGELRNVAENCWMSDEQEPQLGLKVNNMLRHSRLECNWRGVVWQTVKSF